MNQDHQCKLVRNGGLISSWTQMRIAVVSEACMIDGSGFLMTSFQKVLTKTWKRQRRNLTQVTTGSISI